MALHSSIIISSLFISLSPLSFLPLNLSLRFILTYMRTWIELSLSHYVFTVYYFFQSSLSDQEALLDAHLKKTKSSSYEPITILILCRNLQSLKTLVQGKMDIFALPTYTSELGLLSVALSLAPVPVLRRLVSHSFDSTQSPLGLDLSSRFMTAILPYSFQLNPSFVPTDPLILYENVREVGIWIDWHHSKHQSMRIAKQTENLLGIPYLISTCQNWLLLLLEDNLLEDLHMSHLRVLSPFVVTASTASKSASRNQMKV